MSDRNTHTGHDANLVHCDFDALAIGQNVRLVFEPAENGMPVARFQPASMGEVHVSN